MYEGALAGGGGPANADRQHSLVARRSGRTVRRTRDRDERLALSGLHARRGLCVVLCCVVLCCVVL
jgi:hypothetical protein